MLFVLGGDLRKQLQGCSSAATVAADCDCAIIGPVRTGVPAPQCQCHGLRAG